MRVQLEEVGGYGNLDKVWKSYNNSISELLPSKLILLYDCDTNKQNADKNKVYKRVVPSIQKNPITVGVENLFPLETVDRVEQEKPQYIDIQPESVVRVRGEEVTIPQSKSVNKDEKGNLCNWMCQNGVADDFVHFEAIFNIIEDTITDEPVAQQ